MPLRNFTARLHAIWLGLPGNLRGALWVTAGTVLFAINDATVKFLGKNISPVEMAAFRYVIGFLLMLPMFMRLGWDGIKTDRLPLHVFRAIIACLAQVGVFYAVVHLLLADATAIAFSRPLFMTVLAVIVLREAVGWRRWTATSIGFVGVLIMARPGQTTFDPISLVAIASAFAFALAVVLIRRLGTTDSPIQIMFYYQLGGVVLFVPTAPFFWTMPTLIQWPPLLMIGVLSTAAMFCSSRATMRARPAPSVPPNTRASSMPS